MKKYLNKKGSAMVLVLAALMILTAVGSVIVAVSAANVSMSRKYSDWSAEYYWLDYAAQDQLGDLDQRILLKAENLAREYLQSSSYQIMEDLSGDYGFLSELGIQPLIYNSWAAIYGEYINSDASPDYDADTALRSYNEKLENLVGQVFDVVYCAYIAEHYDEAHVGGSEYTERGITTERVLQNEGWFDEATLAGTLDEIFNNLKNIEKLPTVKITAMEAVEGEDHPKQVTVMVTLVPPSFSAVQQTRYYAVKANPLYSNALSVAGTITFNSGSNVTIEGDVVSNNQRNGVSLDTTEGNSNGVKALAGARANIFGNIYSAGDVHLLGNESSITVRPYSVPMDGTRNLKQKYLYPSVIDGENPYLLDLSDANVKDFMEGETESGIVPYVFKDERGGNVYCNNLAVERGVQNGSSLLVEGNLWTRDDIQNDGVGQVPITVDGTYIGMRSDADESRKDPNGSSAVINNAYMYGGSITIGGDYIIPGTAFYKLTSGRAPSDQYYQTAESGTAQAGEYFSIYVMGADENDSDPALNFAPYTDSEGNEYSLFESDSDGSTSPLLDRISRFRSISNGLKSGESPMGSGIYIGGDKSAYTLGVVNSHNAVLYMGAGSSPQAEANYVRYTEAAGGLFKWAFDRKTLYFGTKNTPFDKLYDPSAGRMETNNGFYYYEGNTILREGMTGILFCDGDLTLTGTGTFRGSVICTGNLTLSENVKVIYEEKVVRDTLGLSENYKLERNEESGTYYGSSVARRLFSPGEYSAYHSFGVEQVTMISATTGERTAGTSRYVINSWRESRA